MSIQLGDLLSMQQGCIQNLAAAQELTRDFGPSYRQCVCMLLPTTRVLGDSDEASPSARASSGALEIFCGKGLRHSCRQTNDWHQE